jgi:hypothetical protein
MAHTQQREARQIKREGILGRIASGNHLAAQNDELDLIDRGPVTQPMELSEDDWTAADLARDENKGPKLAARNDAQAVATQVMDLDAMRRARWL